MSSRDLQDAFIRGGQEPVPHMPWGVDMKEVLATVDGEAGLGSQLPDCCVTS